MTAAAGFAVCPSCKVRAVPAGRGACRVCALILQPVTPLAVPASGLTVPARLPAPVTVETGVRRTPAAFTVTVVGRPAPQGSKTHKGNGRMVESSPYVKPWRAAVVDAVLAAKPAGWVPLDGPLLADMVFTVRALKKPPKGRRSWAMSAPDLSKLARSTEDALTDAGVWVDDARLVGYGRLIKLRSGDPDPDVLPGGATGCVIRLWRIEDE